MFRCVAGMGNILAVRESMGYWRCVNGWNWRAEPPTETKYFNVIAPLSGILLILPFLKEYFPPSFRFKSHHFHGFEFTYKRSPIFIRKIHSQYCSLGISFGARSKRIILLTCM